MLNNQDFSKLLSQPEKIRFDLKQIETWDKQNVARLKKKTPQASSAKLSKHESAVVNDKESHSYRDRAEERRKQLVSAEELHLENVASQLNAEQSKFLGGDIEHTHLVRGLDFQLLRKNRRSDDASHPSQLRPSDTNTQHSNILSDVSVTTVLGENIKRLILLNKHSQSIFSNLNKFQRNVYDFHINVDSINDIPTTIQRSKSETCDSENSMKYILPNLLFKKLSSVLSNANTKIKMQKRKQEDMYELPIVTSGGNTKPKLLKTEILDDDIFANVGKYVPYGSLDETENEGKTSNSETAPLPHGTGTVKGIFGEVNSVASLFDRDEKNQKFPSYTKITNNSVKNSQQVQSSSSSDVSSTLFLSKLIQSSNKHK